MNIAAQLNHDRKAKASFLEYMVSNYFGFTCDYNDRSFENKKECLPHPATVRFKDLNSLHLNKQKDEDNLLLHCQRHVCSAYCMKLNKNTKKGFARQAVELNKLKMLVIHQVLYKEMKPVWLMITEDISNLILNATTEN